MAAMAMAGLRYFPPGVSVPWVAFGGALLVSTAAILSLGFVIASVVPTARFAQPITALIGYPMLALSGIFFPVDALPPPIAALARVLPLTAGASLLNGIWRGESWLVHGRDVVVLTLTFVLCTALSAKVFRWE